ncbi:MAG: Nif3-like dinuclear metal center hexameric protein [Bacteroidales bacterium]|jgi:dinuclear metal center YbgI/SA1388 family protein|nr:Nif3-like dinuclear metal center hexameric protein [Bacteroidales bacterium]
MKIKDLIKEFNNFAPLYLQEDFDNSGLNVGNPDEEIKGVLLTVDITPEVVEEAIENNCNFIVSHHPLIFGKLKKITGSDYVEKSIILAIKNDISIYCGHTNFDQVFYGVSSKICDKLGLINRNILAPKPGILKKIAVFVPVDYAETVRNAMFNSGAGHVGNYDCCSYNTEGKGSFCGNDSTNPFVGKKGEVHFENEVKIEMIYPEYLERQILDSMINVHPYEEVAYDLIKLENANNYVGLGMVGHLENEKNEKQLLDEIKKQFGLTTLRHSQFLNNPVKKIAVCGGSGAFLINAAKNSGADVFVSADIKYHDYFLAENKILLVDIGHYESEQFTKEIFYDIIMKKNINFAVRFSKINTNPIKNY